MSSIVVPNKRYYRKYAYRKLYKESNKVTFNLSVNFKKGQKNIITEVSRTDTKKMIVVAYRQYGKSFVTRYLTLQWILDPGITVLILSPTNRLGKEIYKKFCQILPQKIIKTNNASDLIIELENGSRILFFSIESIQTIRGFTIDYLIWDEVAHCREYTPDGEHCYYNIISPLMDVKGKKQVFISTPNGASGFFYEQYIKALNKEEGYKLAVISINDDETKTKEFVEEKKKEYPELRFRQEYLCEFLDNGISYFSNFSHLFTDDDYDFSSLLWAGIDMSSTGDDETILTFINSKNQAIQYKIEGTLDSKYSQIAHLLNKYSDNLVCCYIESNSIGAVMGNEIKKKVISALRNKIKFYNTSNKSKNEYVDILACTIEKEEISFQKEEDELLNQFKTFTYNRTASGKITFGATSGNKDDRIISLCLANLCKITEQKNKYNYFDYIQL